MIDQRDFGDGEDQGTVRAVEIWVLVVVLDVIIVVGVFQHQDMVNAFQEDRGDRFSAQIQFTGDMEEDMHQEDIDMDQDIFLIIHGGTSGKITKITLFQWHFW